MAKRRRLTPARPEGSEGIAPPENRGLSAPFAPPDLPDPRPRAPIAQVAGDGALAAAFAEVQGELQSARREGRMVLTLPLAAIRADYLIRDRISHNPEDMAVLKDSLRARGQQTPIEVTDLGQGRYGLISGWRRLQALHALCEETGGLKRFTTVRALLRLPADRPAAYLAMVEENEIRADLSFYERARIVAQAVGEGVFDSDKQALQSLFASVTFSKRSKIKSFLPLVASLDHVLRYPAQIPERLGLALSKALEAPGFAALLQADLRPGTEMTPEEERRVLEAALTPGPQGRAPVSKGSKSPVSDVPQAPGGVMVAPGIWLSAQQGQVLLQGHGVDAALIERLQDWLRSQGQV